MSYRNIFRASGYPSRGSRYELNTGFKYTVPDPALFGEFHSNIEKYPKGFLKLSRSAVEFSYDRANEIYNFLLENKGKDLRYADLGSYLENKYGSELKRFICAIQAYYDSPNPVIDYFTLIKLIYKKDAASYLKKIRNKAWREYFCSYCFVETEEYKRLPLYKIKDIGDVFNYNYWFFWKEEPEDDLKNSFIPVKGISEQCQIDFRRNLLSLLPDSIEEVDEREILLSTSGSSCFDNKSKYVYQAKQRKNCFTEKPLFGKRCHVHVSPDNVRDTVILSVEHSNTVKLLEKQISKIAEKMIYSSYVRNEETFEYINKSFYDNYTYFIERDILKEGLTKPRQLIQLVFDCLELKYPHISHWKYKSIYDSFKVLDYDNIEKTTLRGHGLGMANAITTIIQIVLFTLVKDKLTLEHSIGRDIGCIAYNDDITIGFKDKDSLETYWDIEEDVLEDYDVIRRPEKSYRNANSFAFCETYYPKFGGKKISYKLTELYNAFAMPNISASKHYVNSLSGVEHPMKDFNFYIKELVTFWGYEFFYGEWELPFRLGGWITPSYGKTDISLTKINCLDNRIRRVFMACLEPLSDVFKGKKKGKPFVSPLETLIGKRDLIIPDGFESFYNYNEYESRIDSLFRCRNNDQILNQKFENYYFRRKEIFNKIPPPLRHIDMFSLLKKKYRFKDFLPNRECICPKEIIRTDREDNRLPISPTPLLSILKLYNDDKLPDDIIPIQTIGNDYISIYEGILDRQIRIDDFFIRRNISEPINSEFFRLNVSVDRNTTGYNDVVEIINANIDVNGLNSYPEVRFLEERPVVNDDFWIEVLLSKNRNVFLRTIKRIGIKKFKNFVIDMGNDDNEDLIEPIFFRDKKIDNAEPVVEERDPSSHYGLKEYPRWELDGCPLNNVTFFDELLFIIIRGARTQIDIYGDADHGLFMTPDHIRDDLIRLEIRINLAGGVVTNPRDGFWYVTFSCLDDNSTSDQSDKTEDFSLFD